ncbi:hypothetical protein PybrP1_012834 [[Pythium] brassicae (nom. inval.)]|nr:hypothetical protein PybrP1_012834 [[Pythium] brassicae (nom. inval.)]
MTLRIGAAVLSAVAALSSTTTALSVAPRFGDWVPTTGAAGLRLCANASSCAASAVTITIASLAEFRGSDRTNNSVRRLDAVNLAFGDAYATEYGDGAVALGRRAAAAIPVDSNRSAYALPATGGDPVLTISVSQLVEGRLAVFNDSFGIPVETSAVQVELIVSGWPFEDWNRSLALELAIAVPGGATLPVPQSTTPTADMWRANTSDSVQYDFPRVSIDASGNAAPIDAGVYKLLDEYRVALRFVPSALVKYTFLLSPTSPTPPRPAPRVPPTRLNALPGGLEFCTTSSCSIRDGSLTLVLGQLGNGTRVNAADASIGIETVLSNLSDAARELAFVEQDPTGDGNRVQSLFLSVPRLGGAAVRATRAAYAAANSSDALYMNVTVEHLATASNITGFSSDLAVPIGGAKLSIEVAFPDANDAGDEYQSLVLTLFVSAFEKGRAVETVAAVASQDGAATRVVLGSTMHLTLPTLARTGAGDVPVLVGTKVHTSGEYEGLVQLTLALTPFATTFAYTLGIAADALANGTANATAWAPANTTVVPGFEGVQTKLLALSHGEFGLCLADGACDSASVKLGFSGLGTVGNGGGGRSTQLGRFARAPAFEFRDPVLVSEVVKGVNVTKWTTSFRAFVPQSQLRPPIPFDAAIAGASALPEFAVQVDQYLTAGTAANGNQQIHVPTGALKFSFNLTKWAFASRSDELVLNITLANATGSGVSGALGFVEATDSAAGLSRTVVNVSSAVATVAEFPLFAVVDGAIRPVVITASFDASVGVVVTMRFPSFAHSLYYDPVLSSTAQATGDIRTSPTNLRTRRSKSATMDRTAMLLLAALAFVLVLSAMRCVKRVSVKLDLSKVIP